MWLSLRSAYTDRIEHRRSWLFFIWIFPSRHTHHSMMLPRRAPHCRFYAEHNLARSQTSLANEHGVACFRVFDGVPDQRSYVCLGESERKIVCLGRWSYWGSPPPHVDSSMILAVETRASMRHRHGMWSHVKVICRLVVGQRHTPHPLHSCEGVCVSLVEHRPLTKESDANRCSGSPKLTQRRADHPWSNATGAAACGSGKSTA